MGVWPMMSQAPETSILLLNRRGDINLEIVGGVEVKAVLLADDDLVAFLVDFHKLLEVLIHLHFYGVLVALGNKHFGCASDLDIREIIHRPVLGDDAIPVAVYAFAEDMAAGKKNRGRVSSRRLVFRRITVMVYALGCTQMRVI